jgi:uncharacterized protein YbgA (DUF1722 family)
VNALEHMAGFFKRALSDNQRAELTTAIADYQRGTTTLDDPLGLIRTHAEQFGVAYLGQQVYLKPAPFVLPPA